MIADVWSRRDIFAAAVILVAVAVGGVGRLLDSTLLVAIAGVVAIAGAAVFVAWRVAGAAARQRRPDGRG